MGKILSVGLDAPLLFTREMVLRQTGAEVWSAKFEPAIALIQSQFFDVVLLCHTLPDEDVRQISKFLELFWPNSRVLLVGERPYIDFRGAETHLPLGPVTLVEKIVKLLAHARERRTGPTPMVLFGGPRFQPASPDHKI